MSRRTIYLLACGLWLLWSAIVIADSRPFESISPDAAPAELSGRLQSILERSMAEYSITGAAAGAIVDGRVIWRARAGSRTEAGDLVTGRTAFNLGSVSKPLAGWTVMTLVQEGAIDIDGPAASYLSRWSIPDGGFDSSAVTVRRLLQHTAGLSVHGYGGYEPGDVRPADIVELSQRHYPVQIIAAPGEHRIYSGGGYSVLQMLVEDVTGVTFDRFADAALFDPLGMPDTGFDPARLEEVSEAFNAAGAVIHPLDQIALAATGAYASGDDIERFLQAHFDGAGLLDASSLDVLFGPTPPSRHYGASYTRDVSPGGVILGHGGNNSTWHAQIYVRPDTRDGFYFLTNTTTGAQLGLDLACAWRSWALEDEAKVICEDEKSLVRSLTYWSAGLGGAAILISAWLVAGLWDKRRRLTLKPAGRGPLRLGLRLVGAVLVAAMLAGGCVVFFTNTIYWRSGVVFMDEIPLDELEWMIAAVTATLVAAVLALWSSPASRET